MAHVAHFSINANDMERAKAFYTDAFGWSYQAYGPPGFYMIEGAAGPGNMLASLQKRRDIVPVPGAEPQRLGFIAVAGKKPRQRVKRVGVVAPAVNDQDLSGHCHPSRGG